ncbi:hypothetical protein BaRGS_00005194, partial [Batillaria attramentaria]
MAGSADAKGGYRTSFPGYRARKGGGGCRRQQLWPTELDWNLSVYWIVRMTGARGDCE